MLDSSHLRLVDVSACTKVSMRGRGVPNWCARWLCDTPAAKPLGVATLAGNVLACRLTEEHVLLLGAEKSMEIAFGDLSLHASALQFECKSIPENVIATNATSVYAGFVLNGKRLTEVMRQCTDFDAMAMPTHSCAQTNLLGVQTLAVRSNETSELRIYLASEYAEYFVSRFRELADGSAHH
jgi:hypothetical protein